MINKRLVAAVPGARRYVIADAALQWLALAAQIAMMSVISLCIAHIVHTGWNSVGGAAGGDTQAMRRVAWAIGMSVLLAIVSAVCMAAASRMGHRAASMAKATLRTALFGKLLALGPAYDQKVGSAEAVQMSVEGVDQMDAYFAGYLPQFLYAMAAPITLFAYMCTFSPLAAIVLLVGVPLIPIIIALVQTIAKRIVSKYWTSFTSLGDSFLESLQGLTTLIVYGADGRRHEQMDKDAEDFRRATMRMLTMQLNSIAVMDLVAYGGAAAGAIIAAAQARSGSVDLAHALLIVLLAADYFLPMRRLGSYFHVALNGSAAANRMFRILDLDGMPTGTERIITQRDGANAIVATQGGVSAAHMSFAYPPRDESLTTPTGPMGMGKPKEAATPQGAATQETGGKSAAAPTAKPAPSPALTDLTFVAPAGSFLGIVGGSGSGKSTLARLLAGRLAGYQGSLAVCCKQIRDVDVASLMRAVTLVESDSRMIPGTVRDNLAMARPDATDAELAAALHEARLDTASDGRLGLDTVIESGAANLSGGQRQRLALARALLRRSPVYIFDEATSNVDPESERIIMQAIRRLAGTHTVILISHRLINVTGCDIILVLDHGRIAERGTHAGLLAQGGEYARMWHAQQELEAFAGETTTEAVDEAVNTAVNDAAAKTNAERTQR